MPGRLLERDVVGVHEHAVARLPACETAAPVRSTTPQASEPTTWNGWSWRLPVAAHLGEPAQEREGRHGLEDRRPDGVVVDRRGHHGDQHLVRARARASAPPRRAWPATAASRRAAARRYARRPRRAARRRHSSPDGQRGPFLAARAGVDRGTDGAREVGREGGGGHRSGLLGDDGRADGPRHERGRSSLTPARIRARRQRRARAPRPARARAGSVPRMATPRERMGGAHDEVFTPIHTAKPSSSSSNGSGGRSSSACCSPGSASRPSACWPSSSGSRARRCARPRGSSWRPATWRRGAATAAARSWPRSCRGRRGDGPMVTDAQELRDLTRFRLCLELGPRSSPAGAPRRSSASAWAP